MNVTTIGVRRHSADDFVCDVEKRKLRGSGQNEEDDADSEAK